MVALPARGVRLSIGLLAWCVMRSHRTIKLVLDTLVQSDLLRRVYTPTGLNAGPHVYQNPNLLRVPRL